MADIIRFGAVIPQGAVLPATCLPSDVFYLTVAPVGTYIATAANTWTLYDNTVPIALIVTDAISGIVPATGGGTANFLRADATWDVPPGSGGGGDLLAANNLSDVASAATSRTNLSLGNVNDTSDAAKPVSTATQTALDGKASTAHAATHLSGGSDPLAAATTTARGTVELATDGESAANVAVQGNDARMSNARTPTAHASSHVTGGSDVIANAVAAGNAGLLTGGDKTKLDAQSGTNTGDQTSIVGLTGTLAQFNTALTGADFASGGGTATGTNTGDQTSVSGNAGTATALQTPRTINGASFDGTANITAKLDDAAAPDDNTDLNATTSAHGLMPKGTGSTTTFFRSDMTQATPAGGSGNTAYAPGSFTVATGNFGLFSRHLSLTTTQRATLAGTATLRIS